MKIKNDSGENASQKDPQIFLFFSMRIIKTKPKKHRERKYGAGVPKNPGIKYCNWSSSKYEGCQKPLPHFLNPNSCESIKHRYSNKHKYGVWYCSSRNLE